MAPILKLGCLICVNRPLRIYNDYWILASEIGSFSLALEVYHEHWI
jgi:hypothetical protein